jgi:hypothetical protein
VEHVLFSHGGSVVAAGLLALVVLSRVTRV